MDLLLLPWQALFMCCVAVCRSGSEVPSPIEVAPGRRPSDAETTDVGLESNGFGR